MRKKLRNWLLQKNTLKKVEAQYLLKSMDHLIKNRSHYYVFYLKKTNNNRLLKQELSLKNNSKSQEFNKNYLDHSCSLRWMKKSRK